MEKRNNILYLISEDNETIIRRLKRLPEDADAEDVCLALDEILYELSAGQ